MRIDVVIRALTLGSLPVASIAVCVGCSCLGDCGKSDTSDALRSVPVSLDASLPAGMEFADEQGAVTRRSYSIEADGTFTFHSSFEREVATIGAEVAPLDKSHAERHGLEPFTGVLIRSIDRNGPAGVAGLKPGDAITAFGGKDVMSVERLDVVIEAAKPGDRFDLSYQRDRKSFQTFVTLGSEKRIVSGRSFQQKLPVLDDRDRTGLKLAELTPEARAVVVGSKSSESGLLVMDVLPSGPAFFGDLRVKDLIVKVREQAVPTVEAYRSALAKAAAGDRISFAVRRAGQDREAKIKIDDNAQNTAKFDVLGLIEYEGRPEGSEFSLIWDMLFHYKTCYAVHKSNGSTRNVSKNHWALCLHLISWHGTKGGEKELRLLWLFPISWGR